MKRIIEIKINPTNDMKAWDSLPILKYHATCTKDADTFVDILAAYNKAQVRWNWFGETEGHYSKIYGEEVAYA